MDSYSFPPLPLDADEDFAQFVAALAPICDDFPSVKETLESTPEVTNVTPEVYKVPLVSSESRHGQRGSGWNPNPSVPEFYREELTSRLADLEGLSQPDIFSGTTIDTTNSLTPSWAGVQPSPFGKSSNNDNSLRKHAAQRQAHRRVREKRKVPDRSTKLVCLTLLRCNTV